MTVNLAKIIRPFESEEAFQVAQGLGQIVTPQTAILEWGGAGSTDFETDTAIISFVTSNSNYKEQFRVTEPHRVENPNDSSQFVIVDRIKQIAFKKTDNSQHKFELKV